MMKHNMLVLPTKIPILPSRFMCLTQGGEGDCHKILQIMAVIWNITRVICNTWHNAASWVSKWRRNHATALFLAIEYNFLVGLSGVSLLTCVYTGSMTAGLLFLFSQLGDTRESIKARTQGVWGTRYNLHTHPPSLADSCLLLPGMGCADVYKFIPSLALNNIVFFSLFSDIYYTGKISLAGVHVYTPGIMKK